MIVVTTAAGTTKPLVPNPPRITKNPSLFKLDQIVAVDVESLSWPEHGKGEEAGS